MIIGHHRDRIIPADTGGAVKVAVWSKEAFDDLTC